MADKPSSRAGYSTGMLDLVRATCLYVATVLGDLSEDIIVVGGLVPSLLVEVGVSTEGAEAHVGTLDLDLGLSTSVFDGEKYQALASRLREAGFSQDHNAQGKPTRQRWKVETSHGRVTVDFLIPPTRAGDSAGRLRNLEADFAAILTPGLELAFRDRSRIELSGLTLLGEQAERSLWVCGPGAFIVLKALAFEGRGSNKDAYDLYYVLRSYGRGVEEVSRHLRPLLDHAEARRAVSILRRDFSRPEALGPQRAARFISGQPDDDIQADVAGHVLALLARLD